MFEYREGDGNVFGRVENASTTQFMIDTMQEKIDDQQEKIDEQEKLIKQLQGQLQATTSNKNNN